MCLGGKSEHTAKSGRYRCSRCDAVSKKKSHICKPKKIKRSNLKAGRPPG